MKSMRRFSNEIEPASIPSSFLSIPLINNNNNSNNNSPHSSQTTPTASRSHHPPHSTSPPSPIINSNASSSYKLDPTSPSSSPKEKDDALEYGFVPRHIINAMKDKDWKVRSEAIEKIYGLVLNLPESPAGVLPHLPNLIRFVGKLLYDPNFTIALTTIRLVLQLVPKLNVHLLPTLSFFLPTIIEKFGDSKIIIRQETMKVVSKIMQIVSPSSVIDVIKACYAEKSSNVQQHLLIVIIKALLAFKGHAFDYSSIIPILVLSLHSSKVKVRQAGIEALAIVNSNLSESQASAILDPVLQSNCDSETYKMVQRRFTRGQLPIIGPDGNVEFKIGADGSVLDEFFDPAVANTPAPSPVPSRIHTPHASQYSVFDNPNNDVSLSDLRPARHWSAGAKTPTAQPKLPPWFPIASPSSPSSPSLSSSPSISGSFSPFAPSSEESHTDVRKSVFQRTRSLSLSDKVNVSGTTGEDNPIFRNNPYSVPAGNNQSGYYYNSAASSPVNLPPITTGMQRIASPLQGDTFFPSNGVMPNLDSDVRKRIRPPSPSLITSSASNSFSSPSSTNTLHTTLRETGYTPSFGKKGHSAYPPSIPFDLDSSSESTHSNSSNINSTFHTMRPTKNTSSLTVLTNFDDTNNNNNDTDPALQHRARIWSTLKPSALATFPVGSNETPKRKFSGRARKEVTTSDGIHNEHATPTSNYGILENVEDDFDFSAPVAPAKSEHPKSATRRQQQQQQLMSPAASDDLQHIKSMPAPHTMVASPQEAPRSVSVMGGSPKNSTIKPRSGHSRHLSRDRDAESASQLPAAPTSSASGPRVVNTSPSDIVPTEQLLPFDNPDAEFKQIMEWFANGEWYHQFEALASVRILAAYHQRVVIPQIHPLLTAVLAATNNLRSLVSRHALVCIGDLFKHVGKHTEPHLDEIMLKVLKKYNESNNFLEKELDRAMGLMLLNVGEARAVGVLLVSAGNKAAPVKCKVAFFLANLVDILGNRVWNMREVDRVMTVVIQLVQESSAEARAQGRRALFLMHQSGPDEFQRVLRRQCNEAQLRKCQDVLDKILSCGDPVTLGSKKPSSAKPARTPKSSGSHSPNMSSPENSPNLNRERSEHKETPSPLVASPMKESTVSPPERRRETPVRGRSPMRDMSKGTPISSNALPELEPLLNDLDNSDWRTRYNAIVSLVELSLRDAKTQVILTARIVKIFDHFTPRLQDANSKVNMHALTSLKQLIPQFSQGMDSVLGVLVPALIMNLASTKPEPRALAQEALDELVAHADAASLVSHFSNGFATHANPKVKVVLLQMMSTLAGLVYSSKPSAVTKHILPIAFKLLDEKKGELRTVNTKLLQSLFRAMGNALWENSNSFNLSKQDQTRLHEILTS